MKPRSTIKTDLFTDVSHRQKIDALGDPLSKIASHIDFAVLAAEIDHIAPRTVSPSAAARLAMPVGWKPAKRRQKDLDATCTNNDGKSHLGYKLSVSVDKRYKIIRKIETDTPRTHDSQLFDKVFDTANTGRDVYADRGYPSVERKAWLKENGLRNQIERKGYRNKPLSECQQRRNQRTARTRTLVERVFGAIEHMGGKLLRSIGQARTNVAMTMMAACCNLKRLVYFQKVGVRSLLTPEMGRIAAAQGDSRQNGAALPATVVISRRK